MLDLKTELSNKAPRCGNVTFVSIDGHGGSGKTTLAELLAEKVGCEIVHTDDFANWDKPLNWWPDVVDKVFIPISNGVSTVSYPRSSWWENHNPEPVENQTVTPIMILEGVGASREEFTKYLSYKIFVDTPIETCLERGVARDVTTGKNEDELRLIWNKWLEVEQSHFEKDKPKTKANLILDGTIPFIEQIRFN